MTEQKAPNADRLPELVALLDEFAAGGDDSVADMWEFNVNPWMWRVVAHTQETYPDADQAAAAGARLFDKVREFGPLAPVAGCQHGADSSDGERDGLRLWRGFVDIVLAEATD